MKKKKILLIVLIALVAACVVWWLFSREKEVVAYKPNIYLYPDSTMTLDVQLAFPKGGKILKSIPEYGRHWSVRVNPSGSIDRKYAYLFYESSQPDAWQRERGWCVEQKMLPVFLDRTLRAHGFNDQETNDFISHWIPRLKNDAYYTIYPQYNEEVDPLIELQVSGSPREIFRVHFLIEGSNEKAIPLKINPRRAKRKGFHVMEWGVLM